jgi:hypothetical protein
MSYQPSKLYDIPLTLDPERVDVYFAQLEQEGKGVAAEVFGFEAAR